MTSTDNVSSTMIDIAGLDWAEMAPGVMAKRVWAAGDGSRIALFIRFAPGAALSRHVHNGDELVYVLEGTVADDHGTVTAGTVGHRPNGCTHTVRSPTGGTAFAVITGGIAPQGDDAVGGPASEVFDLPTMAWSDLRPGIRAKQFFADEAVPRTASLVRYEPGSTIDLHRHDGDELVFVIEGTVEDETGPLRPGMVGYRPNGCVHTVHAPNGATAINYLWGGVQPL